MNFKPTAPLSGFIELSPGAQKCFDECAARMKGVFLAAGFKHIDLPAIERAEVLTDKDNLDEIETQMYLFKKGDTSMGLRYDQTVGLARYVAGGAGDLVFPFRAYQFGRNYRGERPKRGRYREFYQMDADILGINSLSLNYDAEIVAVFSKAYESCAEYIGKTFIKVGSRPFWDAMFEYLGLGAEESKQVFVLIDKKDKIGDEFEPAVRGLIGAKADEIFRVFSEGYKSFRAKTAALSKAVDEIDEFMGQLDAMGIKNAEIDVSVMRGHAYYTGLVFEVFLEKLPELGSVGGGGRYADLCGKFGKTKIVGVGAAVGFSRMMVTLLDEGMIDLSKFEDDVDTCVLVMDQGCVPFAMAILSKLRSAGIVSVPFLDVDKKFKSQMEFANKICCKFSVIIGEDEVKNNTVTLKDMKSGEQKVLAPDEALKFLVKTK
ncbi:MAG: histidine--tRNA ligase [Rickettsiales bacterium]|jgi:histidyl-tRNA synthetase|nr:histidine--tRNA ligase [Rickettsiales bacterium]